VTTPAAPGRTGAALRATGALGHLVDAELGEWEVHGGVHVVMLSA
jgi:hypothetical protein